MPPLRHGMRVRFGPTLPPLGPKPPLLRGIASVAASVAAIAATDARVAWTDAAVVATDAVIAGSYDGIIASNKEGFYDPQNPSAASYGTAHLRT